jgi:hypothetical protein
MIRSFLTFSLLSALWIIPAGATVLTFDIAGQALNDAIPQAYGDRVTATTMGSFSYGAAGGFTPNVVVSYGPSDPAGQSGGNCLFNASACVYTWDNNFADLTNVVAQAAGSGPSVGILELMFVADPGFLVNLASLNLGGWKHGDNTYPATYPINSVSVYDAANLLVYSSGSQSVPVNDPGHLTIAPNVSGQSLRLVIDASNLSAAQAQNVGLDNVQFSQIASAVPEPAAFLLTGAGLAALFLARRRS